MASTLCYPAGIRRARACLLTLAVGLVAEIGAAAPVETEPIRIEYSAPTGCPSAGAFTGRVFERTTKARAANEGESARTFVVVIEQAGSSTQGSLVVRQDGMSTVARRVAGKDCDEVARALSLATALAIDPEAALVAPESQPGGEGTPAEGSNTAAGTPAAQQDDPARRTDTPPEETPSPSSRERRVALLVGPSAAFGPAPTPSFGASVGLEWSSPDPVVLLSALGLELVFMTGAEHAVSGADSSFSFAFARPYLCAFGLPLGAKVGLSPCVAAELGAVVARGSGLANPASETRFWSAAELGMRFDVALSDDWFVDATGSAVFPFTRYRFLFETPDTRIHDVPAVTAAAGLRVGRRL